MRQDFHHDHREWLQADGRGGYAMGSACGIALRRYHGLLITPTRAPLGRYMCVNSLLATLVLGSERIALSSLYFPNNSVHPDGVSRLVKFEWVPYPQFTYQIEDGLTILVEILTLTDQASSACVLRYTLSQQKINALLEIRPLLSVRDHHSLHTENSAFDFTPTEIEKGMVWSPYKGCPKVSIQSDGRYQHSPLWYNNVRYPIDEARGYPATEDLASPGEFNLNFSKKVATILLQAGEIQPLLFARHDKLANARQKQLLKIDPHEIHNASFFAKRGQGATILAGFPWFGDWGRDTFISIRGLCFACDNHSLAETILCQWSETIDQGMIPNRFPEGGTPEYNSVDASLWFVVAAFELLTSKQHKVSKANRSLLCEAILKIINAYTNGTRFGIECDRSDRLLWSGQPNSQLTWMDAKFDGVAVTPRVGKPVEIQALWINSLYAAVTLKLIDDNLLQQAQLSFRERFWSDQSGYLADVVDCDRQIGQANWQLRPNQIFAVGGLPLTLIGSQQAKAVVDRVERELLTPLGLRTLSPQDSAYCGRYEGSLAARDASYHQGTVWPWLIGPFIEAWLRVRSSTREARREARLRFLTPLEQGLGSFGLGALPEIADGDAPHLARGAPFQAWSLAEYLRVKRLISL